MLDFITSSPVYLYSLSIVITVTVLVFSTKYMIKTLICAPDKTKKADGKAAVANNEDEDERRTASTAGKEGDNETSERITSSSGKDDTTNNMNNGNDDASLIDPVEYCEHIQSEVKKAKQRVTEKKFCQTLTPEQMQEEKEIQRQQLEAIFKIMQDQDRKFGVGSIEDVQKQMKLYG